jgi:3-dehydroquinate synthase class II
MRKLIIAAAAVAAATPALAQVNTGSGLVAVNIQNVDILKNFLNDTQVSALNNVTVPVTVNVPIGVAANVCGVNANVLASQKGDTLPTCDAKSGSKALAQNFVTQVLEQKRGN